MSHQRQNNDFCPLGQTHLGTTGTEPTLGDPGAGVVYCDFGGRGKGHCMCYEGWGEVIVIFFFCDAGKGEVM